MIDADDIAYESIDSSDTNRHEYYYGTGIMAVRKEDIDEMPTIEAPHWTPCSKGLPKTKGMYYVTTKGKQEVARFVFTGTDSSKEYWRRNVLAWMPLPEPYGGESE